MTGSKHPAPAAAFLRIALPCISLAVMLGFAAGRGMLAALDRHLFDLLAALRTDPGPWLLATGIGDAPARLMICAAAMALVLRRGHGLRAALFLPLAALAETLATSALKLVFARPRPELLPHLDAVSSYSYPSGHAAHTIALWLLAAGLAFPGSRPALAAALIVPVLVGVSRVVLGVHWPTDVAGGWLFGAGIAMLALSLRRENGTISGAAA